MKMSLRVHHFIGSLLLISTSILAQRDPYLQPFSVESPWNMPIHKNAVYVNAEMQAPTAWGVTIDEENIVIAPNGQMTNVYENGWATADRCRNVNGFMTQIPLPAGFQYNASSGNGCASVLDSDGIHYRQFQSLHRCGPSGDAYALVEYPKESMYGAGLRGAHGGSNLSAIGGSIRVGELIHPASAMTDTNAYIRHALKLNVFGKKYLKSCLDGSSGYRWPAIKADSYACNSSNAVHYGGTVNAMKMGSLVAIPKSVNLEAIQFNTVPGKVMARTLQRYGAYIVDDTAWDVFGINVQVGHLGDVGQEFSARYGYTIIPQSRDDSWAKDMINIIKMLYVVDNNTPTTIGGGPTSDYANRLAPVACPIGTPGSGLKCPTSYEPPPPPTPDTTLVTGVLEAESADEIDRLTRKGTALGGSSVGAWAKWSNLNFEAGYTSVSFTYGVPSPYEGNQLKLRTGSITGPVVAEITTKASAAWETYRTETVDLQPISGVVDLFVTYEKGATTQNWVADLDKLEFGSRPPSAIHFVTSTTQLNSAPRLIADPNQGIQIQIPNKGIYNLNGTKSR
jgi:hypothetical protein